MFNLAKLLLMPFFVLILSCQIVDSTDEDEPGSDDDKKDNARQEDTVKVADLAQSDLVTTTGNLKPKGDPLTLNKVEGMLESIIGPLQVAGGQSDEAVAKFSTKLLQYNLGQDLRGLIAKIRPSLRETVVQRNGIKFLRQLNEDQEEDGPPDCITFSPAWTKFEAFGEAMNDPDDEDNLATVQDFLKGLDASATIATGCDMGDGTIGEGTLTAKADEGIDLTWDATAPDNRKLAALKGKLTLTATGIKIENTAEGSFVRIGGKLLPRVDLVNEAAKFRLDAGLNLEDFTAHVSQFLDEVISENLDSEENGPPMTPPYQPQQDPWEQPDTDCPPRPADWPADSPWCDDTNTLPEDDYTYYLTQDDPPDDDYLFEDSSDDEFWTMDMSDDQWDEPVYQPYNPYDGQYQPVGYGYGEPEEPTDTEVKLAANGSVSLLLEEIPTKFLVQAAADLNLSEVLFKELPEDGSTGTTMAMKGTNKGSLDLNLEPTSAHLKASLKSDLELNMTPAGENPYKLLLEQSFEFDGQATGTGLKSDIILETGADYEGQIESLSYTLSLAQSGTIDAPDQMNGTIGYTIDSSGSIDREKLDFVIKFDPEVSFLNPQKKELDLEDLDFDGYFELGLKFDQMDWGDAFLEDDLKVIAGSLWLSFSVEFTSKETTETIPLSLIVRAPIKDNEVDPTTIEYLIKASDGSYYLIEFEEDYEGNADLALTLIDEAGNKAFLEFDFDEDTTENYTVTATLTPAGGGAPETSTFAGSTFTIFREMSKMGEEMSGELDEEMFTEEEKNPEIPEPLQPQITW